MIPQTSTNHARHRQQNRSIPDDVIDLVLDYGRTIRRRGADVYLLGRKERQRLAVRIGSDALKALERKLRAYVVVGNDGRAITCGWRIRRLHSNEKH